MHASQGNAPEPSASVPRLFDTDADVRAEIRNLEDWPDQAQYPTNIGTFEIEPFVLSDLHNSAEPLIITGYSSLEYLLEQLPLIEGAQPGAPVRIVFGAESALSAGAISALEPGSVDFEQEIRTYWLRRGLPLGLVAPLCRFVRLVAERRVEIRILSDPRKPLLARMIVGDRAAMLGSSGFHALGMRASLDANLRCTRIEHPQQYADIRRIAENFWAMADDWTSEVAELLQQLLRIERWQQLLCEQAGDLLQGRWADPWRHTRRLPQPQLGPPAWPLYATALWLLQTQGALVLDSRQPELAVDVLHRLLLQQQAATSLNSGRAGLLAMSRAHLRTWEQAAERTETPLDSRLIPALNRANLMRPGVLEWLDSLDVLAFEAGRSALVPRSGRGRALLAATAHYRVIMADTRGIQAGSQALGELLPEHADVAGLEPQSVLRGLQSALDALLPEGCLLSLPRQPLPGTVLSFVEAQSAWALVVVELGAGAPCWVLLESARSRISLDIARIAGRLPEILKDVREIEEPDQRVVEQAEAQVHWLERRPWLLLSPQRRHAIVQMHQILERLAGRRAGYSPRLRREIREFLEYFDPESARFGAWCWDQLAMQWIALVRPRLLQLQLERSSAGRVPDETLARDMLRNPPDPDQVRALWRDRRSILPLRRRVRAMIAGVVPD